MIKSHYLYILLFTGAILAGGAYAYLSAEGEPGIKVSPSSYDFGEVPYAEVEKVFTVANNGSAPLEIKAVSTSCGCTEASMNKSTINPGESAELLVTFDPSIMEGEVSGKVYREVYILSNVREKEVIIPLTAFVVGGDGE